MNLFFDIETIRSSRSDLKEHLASKLAPPKTMKKQETIDKWWLETAPYVVDEQIEKTSLDGNYGEVISISYAIDDGDVKNLFRFPGDKEADMLEAFYQDLIKDTGLRKITKWVGHNIVGFDLPFLHKRFILNDVPIPSGMPINPKSWDKNVFDTSAEWAGHGNRIGQDELCFILNIQQKPDDINGSNVGQHYIDGNFEKIINYNNYDVETTRLIYSRLNQL